MKPQLTGGLLAATIASAAAMAAPPPRFPPGSVWHREISAAPVHPQSATMISTLNGLGGFGFGRMQIDFGMHIVPAAAGSPTRTIVGYPYDDYYSPDCEPIGSIMPVPANAAIESTAGMT